MDSRFSLSSLEHRRGTLVFDFGFGEPVVRRALGSFIGAIALLSLLSFLFI